MDASRITPLLAVLVCGCPSSHFPAPLAEEETDSGSTTEAPAPECNESAIAVSDCVERDRYITDLTEIAAPRPPGDAHWQAVQDLGFDRLTELGYEVELHQYGTGINVIGTLAGTTLPNEVVLISAHYDHIASCQGADDNATGVAGALEIARVLAGAEYERTVVIALWDQEEVGLIGSRSWALRASQDSTNVIANFNFEMIGYTDTANNSQSVPAGFDLLFPDAVAELVSDGYVGDFIAVVSDDLSETTVTNFASHGERVGLPVVRLPLAAELKNSPLVADLRRSDHASLWEFDYPAMMLTDTANFRNLAYHCVMGDDTIDRLDHEFTEKVMRATAGAAVDTLGLVPPTGL